MNDTVFYKPIDLFKSYRATDYLHYIVPYSQLFTVEGGLMDSGGAQALTQSGLRWSIYSKWTQVEHWLRVDSGGA